MFDRNTLADALRRHPAVVRVTIAALQGSSPRDPGTEMLVWEPGREGGQAGTIGGGALEFMATGRARRLLVGGGPVVERVPLGPGLGQCCGGAVTLVYERFDSAALAGVPERGVFARRVSGAGEMPLAVRRLLRDARGQGVAGTLFKGGWLAEPIARPARELWIWGAGHVGRALVSVLSPLPDFAITWVDTAAERFPHDIAPGVTPRIAPDPADLVAEAPAGAEHLVLTYSHALDLELCHRLLCHGFSALGLIGSDSKAARFRSRLAALGHGPGVIGRIRCPIGDPSLGKHPQAIAVSVAADILRPRAALTREVAL